MDRAPNNKKSFFARLFGFFRQLNSMANHDFCPWANKFVYWLKQPVGWVVCGIFFSAMVGLLIGPQGFVIMWTLLSLLVAGAIWPLLSMKGLSGKVVFRTRQGIEDEDVFAELEITNRWPLPVFGLMLKGQFLQELNGEDDLFVGLKRVPAMSTSTFRWSFVPKRRGVLPIAASSISNGFPFGIYESAKPIKIQGSMVVWPKSLDLNGTSPISGLTAYIEGMASDRSGEQGDTIGVRGYRHGDSMRNIHWMASAKKQSLIVKERQINTSRPSRIILDLRSNKHGSGDIYGSFEWSIRVASTISRHLHQHQYSIMLEVLGVKGTNSISNNNGIEPIMDFLARMPEWNSESNHSEALLSLSGFPGETFVVTTDRGVKEMRDTVKECCLVMLNSRRFDDDEAGPVPDITFSPPNQGDVQVLPLESPLTVQDDISMGWERTVQHGS